MIVKPSVEAMKIGQYALIIKRFDKKIESYEQTMLDQYSLEEDRLMYIDQLLDRLEWMLKQRDRLNNLRSTLKVETANEDT